MKKICETTYSEIESYLIELGSFNQNDTRHVLTVFPRFYLVSISQDEFLKCVFLSTRVTERISPPNQDRRLLAVTDRAMEILEIGRGDLGPNWDIQKVFDKSVAEIKASRDPIGRIVLRDPKDNETRFRPVFKYIHDGCHRSLGYAMAVKQGIVVYTPVQAYLTTAENV